MLNDVHEQQGEDPARGLLRPGRFLWARAVPWSIVLGMALWIAYKLVKGASIDWGLDASSGMPTVLGALATFALYALSVRLIERRKPDELGLARLGPELVVGLALGAALFSTMMVVLLATGAYAMTGPEAAAPWGVMAGSLDGAAEELIFRGAIFRLLWSALGVGWGIGLSSTLFGAAHLIKPSTDVMAVLGIIFAGGIPMAALCLLTGRLWASIGYHIAWNFTEAYLFGAQVSGTQSGASLFQVQPVSGVDPLWSGGAFGPEASVANVVMGALVGAALLALAKHRSRMRCGVEAIGACTNDGAQIR
jgi:membrane protease YdiL (CAAX protease family)